MSRIDISTRDLFLRIGTTPHSRSSKADRLFRRLRSEEAEAIVEAIFKPSARLDLDAAKPEPRKKKSAT